jgi:hypothetical protein
MTQSNFQIKILYKCPYLEEPDKTYETEWMNLKDFLDQIIFFQDDQLDFVDGSYLRLNEMEGQYTTFDFRYVGIDSDDRLKNYLEDNNKMVGKE